MMIEMMMMLCRTERVVTDQIQSSSKQRTMKSAFLPIATAFVVGYVWLTVPGEVCGFQASPRTTGWNIARRVSQGDDRTSTTTPWLLYASSSPNNDNNSNNSKDDTRTTQKPTTLPSRATDVTITKAVKSPTPNVKSSTTLRSIDENIYNFNKAVIDTVYDIICFLYPVRGTARDFARFYVLETVARVPYFAYLSVMHLRGECHDLFIYFRLYLFIVVCSLATAYLLAHEPFLYHAETFGERSDYMSERMRTHYAEGTYTCIHCQIECRAS